MLVLFVMGVLAGMAIIFGAEEGVVEERLWSKEMAAIENATKNHDPKMKFRFALMNDMTWTLAEEACSSISKEYELCTVSELCGQTEDGLKAHTLCQPPSQCEGLESVGGFKGRWAPVQKESGDSDGEWVNVEEKCKVGRAPQSPVYSLPLCCAFGELIRAVPHALRAGRAFSCGHGGEGDPLLLPQRGGRRPDAPVFTCIRCWSLSGVSDSGDCALCPHRAQPTPPCALLRSRRSSRPHLGAKPPRTRARTNARQIHARTHHVHARTHASSKHAHTHARARARARTPFLRTSSSSPRRSSSAPRARCLRLLRVLAGRSARGSAL
jgi:hypothetical protein